MCLPTFKRKASLRRRLIHVVQLPNLRYKKPTRFMFRHRRKELMSLIIIQNTLRDTLPRITPILQLAQLHMH